MMVAVACVGLVLGLIRLVRFIDPFFGTGTVYSERYSKACFNRLRAGMPPKVVEAVIGRPLAKVPWNRHMGPRAAEMWYYTDQPHGTANFHRRWVYFEDGKVCQVFNDFWID